MSTTERAPGLLAPAHRRLSIAIYTTIALVAFEGTSVAAALPDLAADLGNVGRLPWVITAFLFTLGLSSVMAGPLVDALGSRRMFVWSAVAFAGTGFVAGLAPSLDLLIVVRLVQGAAAGPLFAATLAAVNLGFPDRLTSRAFAANSTIWGVMGAAAPAIAAVLLNVASWRWIFFVNLPLGAISLVAGRTTMPERQPGAESPSVDARGVVFAAVFTLASIAAVDEIGVRSLASLGVAGASVLGYRWHARRASRPLVALEHIADQPYRSLALVTSLMLTAAFTANIYVTVYVAAGRGVSNGVAAFAVLFFTVGWTIGANVASIVIGRSSPVAVMSGGLCFGLVGAATVAVAAAADLWLGVVFAGLTVIGVGIGLTTNASLIVVRAATRPEQIGRASAANQFARSQGFTLGAAAGGAILLFVVDRRLGSVEPIRRLLAGDDIVIGQGARDAVSAGYTAAAATSFVVMAAAIAPMIALHRHVADEVPSVDE